MFLHMIFSVFLLNLVTSSAQNGCTENALKPLRAHETDCDKYYQCSNGNNFVFTCGPGTVFDENLQVCNWPSAVDCKTKTTPNKEPSKPPSKDSKKPPAGKPKGGAKPPAKDAKKPSPKSAKG